MKTTSKKPSPSPARHRKIAATYSRVSDPGEEEDCGSIDSQESAQVAMAERLGYTVPPEFRFRETFSGIKTMHVRHELIRLREVAAAGQIDAMFAHQIHRLARNPEDQLAILEDNHALGIVTLFVIGDFDPTTAIGRMMIYNTGFASAMQCEWVAEATGRGRAAIVGKGLLVGTGPPKYGLGWVKETRSRPANPDTAPHVRWMFERAADGMSASAMARDLNARGIPTPFAYLGHKRAGTRWRGSAVSAIIRDRVYIGESVARRTMPGRGYHPCNKRRQVPRPVEERVLLSDARTEALVSRELFDRANRALDAAITHGGGRPGRKEEYLLRGILHCAECGHRMAPQDRMMKAHKTDRRYRCRSYRCTGHKRDDESTCWATVGALWVEQLAWETLERDILDEGYIEGLIEEEIRRLEEAEGKGRLKADIAGAERRSKELEVELRRLAKSRAKATGRTAKALDHEMEDLGAEADDLDRQLEDWRQRLECRRDRRREAEGALDMLAIVREQVKAGIVGIEKRREAMKMLGARFYAWIEADGHRRVRVELPYGVVDPHDVKGADTSGSIRGFYTIQLRSA